MAFAREIGEIGRPACRRAGVANNTIIKIEAGKNQNPTLDTLKKIAKALNVSVADLFK
ncbi:helix-turn-helix domain-containing protein [Patescibacteria group bacterium]|nr:helix-turn-helix domain-containing protein [Patescibacteria group bacterium]MBU4056678.1 helix-turn-helix domain-containing protein [Patescibacteria group bacterium]MBU4368826.1 helix-turn-helix domain-containing protein [Patescibacteria group bacterium]